MESCHHSYRAENANVPCSNFVAVNKTARSKSESGTAANLEEEKSNQVSPDSTSNSTTHILRSRKKINSDCLNRRRNPLFSSSMNLRIRKEKTKKNFINVRFGEDARKQQKRRRYLNECFSTLNREPVQFMVKAVAFLTVLTSLVQGVNCVRLVRLSVPSHKFMGAEASLKCLYDLEGEQLYSVKWYKDGHEFYRFIPGDRDQRVTIFKLPGVRVDREKSKRDEVTLQDLDLQSAGIYRCEISAEAPLFNTVSRSSRMDVVVLPRGSPRISGGAPKYHVGDRVKVNCTSERSKPAATLQWYINKQPAPKKYLRWYPPIQHEDGLETAILGLDFEADPRTFSEPELSISLKCSSSVSTVNSEAQTTEMHHQKSSTHMGYGSLFRSGSAKRTSWSLLTIIIIFISFIIVIFPKSSSSSLSFSPWENHLQTPTQL